MIRAFISLFALRAAATSLLPPVAALDSVAIPASPALALSPRYAAIDGLRGREVRSCNMGFHNCADVEREEDCCPDDRVCFFNTIEKTTGCCPIGVACKEQVANCDINKSYECNRTSVFTESGTATTTIVPNCCGRRCPNVGSTTNFMCPTQLWTATNAPVCCPVRQICGASGKCLFSSSTSATSGARPTGGNTGGAGGDPSPTSTSADGPSMVPHDPGLSTGAKAGIGAGVAIGASLLIGAATWLCVRRRRRAASSRGGGSVVTYTYGGDLSGQYSGGRHDTFPHSGPGSGGVGSGAMSETTDGEGRLRGIATDYFGPDATVGPLTDVDGAGVRGSGCGSAGTSPGLDGGVPRVPLHPGHIVAPVEIDSKETPVREAGANGRPGGDGNRSGSYYGNTGVHESIGGRFELHSDSPPPAWEGSPALYQGEQEQQPQQQEQEPRLSEDVGTMQTEASPFLPRDATASPRSLSVREMVSPRSVSPVDPPSGHSNAPPGPGQGGGGAQHGTR